MTTTTAESDTTVKDSLEEDFEESVGCETVHQPCDRPVEWLFIMRCCDHKQKLCNVHKTVAEAVDATLERNLRSGFQKRLACFTCYATTHSPEYIPI